MKSTQLSMTSVVTEGTIVFKDDDSLFESILWRCSGPSCIPNHLFLINLAISDSFSEMLDMSCLPEMWHDHGVCC